MINRLYDYGVILGLGPLTVGAADDQCENLSRGVRSEKDGNEEKQPEGKSCTHHLFSVWTGMKFH